jgi:hypothetical protein
MAGAGGDASTAILLDDSLSPLIRLESQRAERDPATGAFIAESVLANKSLQMLDLEFRVLFKDDLGATVDVSGWKPVTLGPAGRTVVMAPSIQPRATRFMAQIRRLARP